MSASTLKEFQFANLKKALAITRLRLNSAESSVVMVAAPTLKEFKRQNLPSHLKISAQKRVGPRVSQRGPRNFRLSRLTLARWPEDGLVEQALPSLACVIRGQADLRIADYVLHCQPGDFVFYPAGTPAANSSRPHFEGETTGRFCDLLWIFPGRIYSEGLECAICHSSEETHSQGEHARVKSHSLAQLFQGLQEELSEWKHHEGTFHLLAALVVLLLREITSGHSKEFANLPYRAHPEHTIQRGLNPIEQACIYIESNIGTHLTIDGVARQTCISSSVFTSRFKKHTGRTFNQYVTALRMERAGVLLRETELKITQISQLVGMKECQFRTLAQRHWNCSPKEFRAKYN